MGAPKPCLGYRSRTEAVLALLARGVPREKIAATIGISMKLLHGLEYNAAHRKLRKAMRSSEALLLPPPVLQALTPHADRRGIKPSLLALSIVETVLAENLIDAVLDDRTEEAA